MQPHVHANAAAASAPSSSERARLAELERDVAAGLAASLRVGRVLVELLDGRDEDGPPTSQERRPRPVPGRCECSLPDPDGIGVCGLEVGWRPTVRSG